MSGDWQGLARREEETGRKVVSLGDILGQPSKTVGEGVTIRKQLMQTRGFPHGSVSGKGSACQCRKYRFDLGYGRSSGGGNGNPFQWSFFFFLMHIILFIGYTGSSLVHGLFSSCSK